MDRRIEVKINGNYLTKDNKNAGVQHEANVTFLRIEFDEGWDAYAKKVTFWNALGLNPVERTLTADLLEDLAASARIYLVPIPGEPLEEAGLCTFVVDGYINGKRQRSVSDVLTVKPAPFIENAGQPADPTPTQAEQLQVQIEQLLPIIVEDKNAAIAAAEAAAQSEVSAAESARSAAQSAADAIESIAGITECSETATEQAQIATQEADRAAASVITSQSWAEGGTGTRAGEDSNNAKYWAEQAKEAVGGDFVTRDELPTAATNADIDNAIGE